MMETQMSAVTLYFQQVVWPPRLRLSHSIFALFPTDGEVTGGLNENFGETNVFFLNYIQDGNFHVLEYFPH